MRGLILVCLSALLASCYAKKESRFVASMLKMDNLVFFHKSFELLSTIPKKYLCKTFKKDNLKNLKPFVFLIKTFL